jgi:hypothetical protein
VNQQITNWSERFSLLLGVERSIPTFFYAPVNRLPCTSESPKASAEA